MKDRVDILEVGDETYVVTYNSGTIPGKTDARVVEYGDRQFVSNEKENENLGELYVLDDEMAADNIRSIEYLEDKLQEEENDDDPFGFDELEL